MRLIITGHREEKLINYDLNWIRLKIRSLIKITIRDLGVSLAYSGMASGVDLCFCDACQLHKLPFIACVPFEEQGELMDDYNKNLREKMLEKAKEIKYVKNSWMVENCDIAIVVFDGNKGGTHNVFQQLIENKKNFYWINPVANVVWKCFI